MTCSTLRIVSDNAADRATITVSPGAVPTLPVGNLKTDIKSDVCRVNSGTVTLTLQWAEEEQISCVAIPACNASSDSEYRVRLYDAADALVHDTDWQWAAPGPILDHYDFTQALNVNGFIEGATIVSCWLDDHYMAAKVVMDLRDPERSYLDIARIVAGKDFKPRNGASYGSAFTIEDSTSASRAASGDLYIDRGTISASLILDLNHIDGADRHRFARILREGVGKFHFVGAIAGAADVSLDQDWSIYGVLASVSPMAFVTYGSHSTQYQIRGW